MQVAVKANARRLAGNEAANNDTAGFYPASYRLPNMIVVAASDQKDALASFSNYGATGVDLAEEDGLDREENDETPQVMITSD
mgnify:CR=1 FL=1